MNFNKSMEKAAFLSYVFNMILEHPEWGGEVIQAITGGMTAKIQELKGKIGISQMAGMSAAGYLFGKNRLSKRAMESFEHILLKSILEIDGVAVGDEVVDGAISRHCILMKDWVDKLHAESHKNDKPEEEIDGQV